MRGEGLSLGVEIVDSRETRNRDCKAAAKISYRCMQNGLLLTFIGKNTLRIQPPLVITKEQLDRAVEILFAAFDSFARGEIDDSALSVVKGW
ncbi:MAG: aminotransferase class III-fold pyridoxal phosphate-dependent enzyme [Bifidobacteriaceae bacterium]|nr:aminotransferase class III-fold pyridoxal phosphate-dependent enzyme [Bifidobacteriaceae bacterium]